MHEAIIARKIALAVRSASEARGAVAVTAIDVDLGELEGLRPEAVQAAFDLEAEGTPLQGAVLRVRAVPARAYCLSCGEERPFVLPNAASHDVPIVACPKCGTMLDLRGGRGFVVTSASMLLANSEASSGV